MGGLRISCGSSSGRLRLTLLTNTAGIAVSALIQKRRKGSFCRNR